MTALFCCCSNMLLILHTLTPLLPTINPLDITPIGSCKSAFFFPPLGVGKIPFLGGGEGDEAGLKSQRSTPGACHLGPESHPGEGSVQAGPPFAKKPLQHGAAVH